MTYIPLRQIGSGGIVSDQNPYDLELTQFPDGNNVAFHDGYLGTTLGYTLETDQTVVGDDNGTPTYTSKQLTGIKGWMADGDSTLIVGSLNKLYRWDGSTFDDVTRTASDYTNSPKWQVEQMGLGMLANNGANVPQYMEPDYTNFVDLPSFPSAITTQCIKPYRSFLVMLGYEEGGNSYPYTVRWSDAYDPRGYPASYSITDTTTLGGENVLSGNNGQLVDQLTLNNAQIIYAERGVFAMDYVGAPFVFTFRDVFNDDGIINRGAVASFFNQHLVVGNNDIYVHDGNQKRSIVDRKVRRTFFNAVADTRSIYCQTVTDRSEVWICYADSDAPDRTSANRALVYNWTQDSFTFIDLPSIRQLTVSEVIDPSGGWDDAYTEDIRWDESSLYWSNASRTTEADSLQVFGVDTENSKIYLMNNSHGADGSTINSYVESTKIDLDVVLGKATNNIKQIKGIMPQIRGAGVVNVSLGVSDAPQDPVTWQSTVGYNIDTDHKIDFRSCGRYFAIRVQSNSNTDHWQLTGLDIDVEEVASR